MSETVYLDRASTPIVIEVGKQGPPGPSADATAGLTIVRTAGENLSGQRAVVIDPTSGKALYASSANVDHADVVVGVTTGAASVDDLVTIRVAGAMTEPGWTWDEDLPVWLGEDGQLTQTVPTTGHSTIVGKPTGPTGLVVAIQASTIL